MHRNPSQYRFFGGARAGLAALLAGGTAHATSYGLTDIVTDDNTNLTQLGFAPAITEDPNVINPWGVSFGATSPFWISDNGTGLASLYRANGMEAKPTSPVTIASPMVPPPGFSASAPTGQVNNPTNGFVVTQGAKSGPAIFIFATEDGTISGWNPNVNPGQSVLLKDNSGGGNGAVYKGLAIGQNGLLYAANFRASAGAGAGRGLRPDHEAGEHDHRPDRAKGLCSLQRAGAGRQALRQLCLAGSEQEQP